jgi:hypothetical protein
VAAPTRDDFLLFVGGEPGSSGKDLNWTVFQRLTSFIFPQSIRWLSRRLSPARSEDARPPAGTEKSSWHLPREAVASVNLVTHIVRRNGRSLTVVDVNRRSGQRALVDRWVTPNTVLPLLVRADGARLEGCDEFIPKRVRRFVECR